MVGGTRVEMLDANTVFGGYIKRSLDVGLGRLLSLLRDHRILRAVTCCTTGVFYEHRTGNEETLAACAAHPELVPAGTIHPQRCFGGEEVGRLKERGFRLLRLFNALQGWPVQTFRPFEMICAAADEAGLPILLDVAGVGSLTAIGQVAQRLTVPVIVAGLNYHGIAEAVAVGREVPNLIMELHQLTVPDGTETLCRFLGSDRLVYGSWAPFNYIRHTLMILEAADISAADRKAIACGNMARILGLT
jgi:predicted TIM-barrel fold metal-dependent hydrolase